MKSTKYRVRKKMDKRTGAIIALCLALVLTLAAGYLGVNGTWLDSRGLYKLLPWLPTADVENWPQPISLGLDLKGGVYVEYEATMSDELREAGYDFDTLLESTMGVIQKRLTEKGYPEATVSQLGATGIRVEIPAVTDPAAVLDLIGSPAKLEFLDPQGNVFMEGRHLQAATPAQDPNTFKPAISFTLTSEGDKLFGEMTAASVGQTITIQLDGQPLMSPTVNEPIYGGQVLVTGDFTAEQAENICLQLQSGALPLELRQDKLDTISATLGIDALATSVTAAMIGILIVMLIMALRYRLAGIVADWALVVYIIVLFLLLAVMPGIQLTLPGIAGIILGIGMAVDANVVIFERVKEEVHQGRPMIHAVRIGFKNALTAVIDANVTTIIAAVVLLFFGTGSVQGFAVTLLLGVVTSMLSAILVTRFLLTRFVRVWPESKLYVSEKKESKVRIRSRFRVCTIISAAVLAVALVLSLFGMGINYGLDFAGGLNIQYNMGAEFDQADVEEALKAQGVSEYSISTSGENGHIVQIRVPQLGGEDEIQKLQNGMEETLSAKYPTMDTATATASYVGPVAGKVLVKNAVWSVVLAAALMLVYIAIRFDLASGMAAVIGLVHDVLMMLAAMVLLRSVIQMNSSFIAAMLTIVGYSINNTIVIFDRIRENNKKPAYAAVKREEVVNISVRESLGRTVNTTMTTLVTIVTLFVLGVSSIREFSLPIIVGIVAGVYSANLINGYVWALLEEKLGKRKAAKPQKTKKA